MCTNIGTHYECGYEKYLIDMEGNREITLEQFMNDDDDDGDDRLSFQ